VEYSHYFLAEPGGIGGEGGLDRSRREGKGSSETNRKRRVRLRSPAARTKHEGFVAREIQPLNCCVFVRL